MAAQPAGEGFLVQGHQGADERAVVAHHEHLRDERVRPDLVLQQGRDHVLAAGRDDDFLLAPGDGQEPRLVQLADVAGAEPAVVVEGRGGQVIALVVAAHDAHALGEDLAVVRDPDGVAGNRGADGADLDQVRGVDRDRRRGFGQPVAFQDLHADALEEVAQPFTERAAAGNGMGDVPAHGGPELAVHELVEHGVLELQHEPHLAGLPGPGEFDGGVRGAVEDGALAAVLGLGQGGVVDLFEDARDGEDEGRLVALQIRQQVLDIRGVRHRDAGGDRQHGDEACEDVGHGQEHDGPGLLVDDRAQRRDQGVLGQFHEVAVGQLAALGPAGGSRGVDDRGDIVQGRLAAPCFELGVADAGSGRTDLVQAVALELPDMPQGGEPLGGGRLPDDVLVVRRFAERGHGAGVAKVPGHLGGGGGLIDRDRDGAGEPDGEVDQGPFIPGAGHDAHPVAGGHTAGHEALGEGRDVGQEIRGADVLPLARRVEPREQRRVGGLGRLAHHEIGDVGVRIDIHQGRDNDFSHDSSFGIHRPARGTAKPSMRSPEGVFCDTYWPVTLRSGPPFRQSGTAADTWRGAHAAASCGRAFAAACGPGE